MDQSKWEMCHKVAVDPGASLHIPRLAPVIPRSEWNDVTHIVVTHADPDHYWHTDRVAKASGAPVICGSELVQVRDGETFLPTRAGGSSSTSPGCPGPTP